MAGCSEACPLSSKLRCDQIDICDSGETVDGKLVQGNFSGLGISAIYEVVLERTVARYGCDGPVTPEVCPLESVVEATAKETLTPDRLARLVHQITPYEK